MKSKALGEFAAQGPIRLGTAFVDRGRCLPWAMDRPCLVCQEVCPVSPKAIFIRTAFETIRDGQAVPAGIQGHAVELEAAIPTGLNLASGDYYLRVAGQPEAALRRITGMAGAGLTLERPLAADGLRGQRRPGGYRGALVPPVRGCRQVYRLRHVRA